MDKESKKEFDSWADWKKRITINYETMSTSTFVDDKPYKEENNG